MDSYSNIPDVTPGEIIESTHENQQSAAINRLEAVLTLNPPKAPVRVATTDAVSASFASDVLTASGNGALSVDGVEPSVGDRVLVKNEAGADQVRNGIYVVTDAGSASAPWVLTRSEDLRLSSQAPGALVFISEGSVNARTQWASTADASFVLNTSDLEFASLTDLIPKAPINSPALTGTPTAPTASPGDNSTQIATTAYVDAGLATRAPGSGIAQSAVANLVTDLAGKASLASPALTGTPTAPTAPAGDNSTQIATTAYVDAGLGTRAPNSGISQSSVTNLVSDLAAKAPLASPALTGTPTAPTASPGDNSTQIATTAYVDAGLATRAPSSGIAQSAVANLLSDLAARAPVNSPALTGTPTAPTASAGDNSTQIATTAYVDGGLATRAPSSGIAQSSVTDLVSDLAARAPLASPALSGTPTAPTASSGDNSTQIATTAYVDAGLATRAPGSGIAQSSVTNLVTDLAARAPLASPALTGTPTAPTASAGDNSTQIATTAYVDAGLGTRAPSSGISQSSVTNLVSDLAAKAPLASPALTGTPTAPTASPATNSTQLATTAYVDAGLATRAPGSGIAQSAVTNLVSDLAAKAPIDSPAFSGTPTAVTANPGTNSTRLATTAYVDAGLATRAPSSGIAQSAVTNLVSDLAAKASSSTTVNGYPLSGNVNLAKSDIGLANVDNTSDLNKPVSTATQTALNGKQSLDADLTAIAGLSTTGFIKRTGDGTATAGSLTAGDIPDLSATYALAATTPPTGAVLPYAGSSAPTGWLLCDGSEALQASYPSLYAVVGSTYGAAAAGYFRLPDLRGRSVVGAGNGTGLTARTLGATGGAETHMLAATEMPSHTHPDTGHTHLNSLSQTTHTHGSGTLSTSSDGAHTHNYSGAAATEGLQSASDNLRAYIQNLTGGSASSGTTSGPSTYHAHSVNSGNTGTASANVTLTNASASAALSNTGGGGAHNNMHPFLALNHIIKT